MADSGANIVRINHAREDRHSDVGACIVTMVVETRDQAHICQLEASLTEKGYFLLDH